MNVFTRSNYTRDGLKDTDRTSALRRAEDAAFAARCGLTQHNLGLDDATVLGLDPFDATNLQEEAGLVQDVLIPFLLALNSADIYCPLGVGGHRNHLSTFAAVVNNYGTLRKQANIFFYEDIPYAAKEAARQEALARLANRFQGKTFSRHIQQLEEREMEEKLALISLYASQFAQPFAARDFYPAAPDAPFPHEAFWEVAP